MKSLLLAACWLAGPALAQTPAPPARETKGPQTSGTLQAAIERAVLGCAGTVGVAVRGLENPADSAQVNGHVRLPMQSVYKFPLALAVLHQVDEGRLSLSQNIRLRPADLLPNTWSPLRERYPQANVDVTLSEVLRYTVSESDNNGCDILFRLLGGPGAVHAYVRQLGVAEMRIAATEEEMHRRWNVQYRNWATPAALDRLLTGFFRGQYLKPASRDFLWKLLASGPTGLHRLRAGVPAGAEVAHKTGTSGTNAAGLTAATNDVGIVALPNGKHFAVVVFVANSPASETAREAAIAAVGRTAWDYFAAMP